ncbi:Serine threonine kinase [Olea europaea subsp. europaea]|uniref:Serine threonine kinase n=1 Tax=Olea europaea subsp. europaea TaxID=158383 RepID=A0A8S0VAW0_OLEEU|nr:Serine threonine kinase [Olea europaea subsp. europaea]
MTELALQRWGISGCQTRCGDIDVPFPFGFGPNCSLDESFFITCNESYNPPKPYLNLGEIEVIDISLLGQMSIAASVASDCYDKSGSPVNGSISELALSEFHISGTQNEFTVIGCDTHAYLQSSDKWKQRIVGCVSLCGDIKDVVNGSCSGIGCCQSSILRDLRTFRLILQVFKITLGWKLSIHVAMLLWLKQRLLSSRLLDLKDLQKQKTVPVVLDWSIGNVTCQVAQKNLSTSGCGAMHSQCIDSSNGLGYHCSCSTGFEGNPYLVDGCHDIDECISTPCEGTCINTLGSYLCSCPTGFEDDGKKDGTGCHPKHQTKIPNLMYIASGKLFSFCART